MGDIRELNRKIDKLFIKLKYKELYYNGDITSNVNDGIIIFNSKTQPYSFEYTVQDKKEFMMLFIGTLLLSTYCDYENNILVWTFKDGNYKMYTRFNFNWTKQHEKKQTYAIKIDNDSKIAIADQLIDFMNCLHNYGLANLNVENLYLFDNNDEICFAFESNFFKQMCYYNTEYDCEKYLIGYKTISEIDEIDEIGKINKNYIQSFNVGGVKQMDRNNIVKAICEIFTGSIISNYATIKDLLEFRMDTQYKNYLTKLINSWSKSMNSSK